MVSYLCPDDQIRQQSSQTSLTSFELSEYHHVIIDQVVCIYHSLVRLIRHRIESLISKRLVI